MLSFIQTYWNFIAREPYHVPFSSGASAVPDFPLKVFLWSMLFTGMNFLVPFLAKHHLTTWYDNLTERKRHEMPAYAVCLIHHFILVPVAWQHIWTDIGNTPSHDYSLSEGWVAPISLGYLIGDTFGCAFPEALRGKFDLLLHHIFTLWLVWSTIWAPAQMMRFTPHLLICDSTNLCFNTAWLLRTTSWKDGKLVTFLELAFAVFFLLFRVINMPTVFLAVTLNGTAQSIGYARLAFLPISVLQWWWFGKVLMGMKARLVPAGKGEKEKENKKGM